MIVDGAVEELMAVEPGLRVRRFVTLKTKLIVGVVVLSVIPLVATSLVGEGDDGRPSTTVMVAVGLVMVAASWVIASLLLRPLSRNTEKLNRVAAGDLEVRFDSGAGGELGRMNTALNEALVGVGETLARVEQNAVALADSTAELKSLSSSMSDSAESSSEQANGVAATSEEISTTADAVSRAMGQMSASVREISDNTAETARMSTEAVEVTSTTESRMHDLEASAADIGNVVNVITSIAEQTDLLALNATIEAARVGEAGKGFAVVANEVKALASQTSTATEEIQAKVEAIQRDAAAAVDSIAEISQLIDRVNEASTTIAGAVEEQSATTLEVTASLGAVTAGTVDISDRIAALADAARAASTGAQLTEDAATGLFGIAEELNQGLTRFELPPAPDDGFGRRSEGTDQADGQTRRSVPERAADHQSPASYADGMADAPGVVEEPVPPRRLEELGEDLQRSGWR